MLRALGIPVRGFCINEYAAPVRKLSLGQRMRAEVALALLHQPRSSFWMTHHRLDIVAKQILRDTC